MRIFNSRFFACCLFARIQQNQQRIGQIAAISHHIKRVQQAAKSQHRHISLCCRWKSQLGEHILFLYFCWIDRWLVIASISAIVGGRVKSDEFASDWTKSTTTRRFHRQWAHHQRWKGHLATDQLRSTRALWNQRFQQRFLVFSVGFQIRHL